MALEISCSPYELKIHSKLHAGALLKFEFTGEVGYSDLRPWPSLGDASLEHELRSLRGSPEGWSRLVQKSLYFAQQFAEGSLFSLNEKIPIYSLMDLRGPMQNIGSKIIKLKVNAQWEEDWSLLLKWMDDNQDARFIIDFNNSGEYKTFSEKVDRELKFYLSKINYLEDPFPYERSSWENFQSQYGVGLALDRWVKKEYPQGGYSHAILKPAYQDTLSIVESLKDDQVQIVTTHYLDHLLGRVCAFSETQKLKKIYPDRVFVCGLGVEENLAQEVFQTDQEQVYLGDQAEKNLREQLKELSWQPLKT